MGCPPLKKLVSAHPQEEQLALLEALEQVPLKVRLEEQEGILGALTPEDLATCALDLRPFMQRTPFVLQARHRSCQVQLLRGGILEQCA